MTDADVTRQLRRLDGLERGLLRRRRIALGGILAGAVGIAPALLAWLPAGARSGPGSPVPLATWILLALLFALLARRARIAGTENAGSRLVREAERSAGLRAGSLQGARELAAGSGSGSSSLAARHRRGVAMALSSRSDGDLLPVRIPAARAAARRGVGLALLSLLLLGGTAAVRPAAAGGAVEALARPWSIAFPPRPPRLRVEGATTVLRGAPLTLRVHAPGRRVVTLVWAEEGEPARRAGVAVEAGTGRAEGRTGPIQAPVRVWAEEPGGRPSDTLRVTPVDPLMISRIALVVEPPAWTGLASDTIAGTASPLAVPAGATIRVSGEATHRIASGSLVREAGDEDPEPERTPLAIEEERFSATLRPARGGSWRFELLAAGPVPGVRPPPPLVIRVLEDRPPEVRVLRPGRDLEAGVEPELPILVDASDDAGVVRVDLVTWRSTAGGLSTEPRRRTLASGPGEARRVVSATLRIAALGLAPGDTLHYRAEARDANPSGVSARSRTWRIWVPALADLARDATERVDALAETAEAVAAEASALSREARDAERLAVGSRAPGSGRETGVGPDYRSTEAARAVRDRGLEVERRLDELDEELAGLQEGLAASPAAHASLRDRLEELAALVMELRESGLGERLQALESAVDDLAGEATRDALARLAEEASDLERRLGETADLMERAAAEQGARDASTRAAELARRQERMAGESPGDPEWAPEQERLAEATEALARRMEAIAARLEAAGAQPQADAFGGAAADAGDASAAMREAAGDARATEGGGEPGATRAARRAGEAASSLRDAARESEEAARSLSRDWREEAVGALDEAVRQSLDLASEQARITEALASGEGRGEAAGRQAAVRAGLERVTRALSEASRRSALVDSRVGPTADRARREMRSLERRLAGDGAAPGGAASSRELTEGLNDLAVRLRASRRAMEGAASGTGLEEALEQLARLGRAQADVNRESGGLLLASLRGEAGAERLARLAGRQAEIARELGRLAESPGGDELPARPDLLAAEADEIAGSIRDSGLDRETVARQERLFRRLLDAGRTLERDPDPGRRASRPAAAASSRRVPPPVETAGPVFPYPPDGRLREISPEIRLLVLDYFDRLNRAAGGRR